MKIKEVEELTGLTPKSIRLYEAKGLIDVERDKGNDYRNYSEENVETLKYIKLYRFIGFSLDDIKVILNEKDKAKKMLREMIEVIKDEKEISDEREKICRNLINQNYCFKSKEDLDKIVNHIQYVENDDVKEYRRILREEISLPGYMLFYICIVCFAPILMLFVDISREYYYRIGREAAVSIIAAVIMVLFIRQYFVERLKYRIEQKEVNRGFFKLIPMAIVFVLYIVLGNLIVFFPTYLIYEDYLNADNFIVAIKTVFMIPEIYIMIVGIIILVKLKDILDRETEHILTLKTRLKLWGILAIISVVIIYYANANFVMINEESIIIHTTFNPKGTVYSYDDIEKIKAGYDSDGEPYYIVCVGGKEYNITDCFEQNEKYVDTYSEVLAFDKIAMKNNVKKEKSHKYQERHDIGEKYKKIFAEAVGE